MKVICIQFLAPRMFVIDDLEFGPHLKGVFAVLALWHGDLHLRVTITPLLYLVMCRL